jgi:hypothetical protein
MEVVMFTRSRTLVVLGSLALLISGIILGVVGSRADRGGRVSQFSPMPLSNVNEHFANDPNPEIRNFVSQLSDPSRFDSLPPLMIQTYSDKIRFSIVHAEHRNNVVSELFGFEDGERQIIRTYTFKEGKADICFTIARKEATNEIIDIVYSFNDKIVYVDKNGDGTWDVVKGVSPTAIPPTNNDNGI